MHNAQSHGGYRYRSRKRSRPKRHHRQSRRSSTRSRSRRSSIGLSLARGRTYNGGNGFPTGYSVGGLLNPLQSYLANPTIISPNYSCNSNF